MQDNAKIKCNNIPYRKGFIEIMSNIHKGLVNLETWNIHVDVDIKNLNLGVDDFPEDAVTGNTEIELSIDDAKGLIKLLQQAISDVESA